MGRYRPSDEEKEFNLGLGRYLRKVRKQNGMTQDEVAALFDLTRQTICNWERGIHPVSVYQYKKFKRLLGAIR